MSIVCMVNEKFRERVPAWEAFKKSSTGKFPGKKKANNLLATELFGKSKFPAAKSSARLFSVV